MIDPALVFGLTLFLVIVVIIVIGVICLYGLGKIGKKAEERSDRKIAAKRDLEEKEILIGGVLEEKEKIGIIISNLEGFLTENPSFWKELNVEVGLPADDEIFNEMDNAKMLYSSLIDKIYSKWKQFLKNSPLQLNREFFKSFYVKFLKIRPGAKEFIEHCKKSYDYYVISEAPWEFCLLAKEQLGFYHYYATSIFTFDRNDQLSKIIAHRDGFQKEKIVTQIIRRNKFGVQEAIVLSNSEKDFTMLNQARFGIFVGHPVSSYSPERPLNENIIFQSDLNFDELRTKLDQITESIKQAKQPKLSSEAEGVSKGVS